MTLVVPNEGEVATLENQWKNTTPESFLLKLYSNNYDTINTATAASFTEVANGNGYTTGGKALARASFSAAVAGSPSYIQYSAGQTWNWTGAIPAVVGYYVVGATSGKVYHAERLYAGAGQAFANGDSLTVTPKITYASATND